MIGYTRVIATSEEVAAFRRKYNIAPTVYRVRCDACGKRLWGSGLGVGSHNRWHSRQRQRQEQNA